MSRYVNKISVSDPNILTPKITTFLQSNGFALTYYGNEPVWQKGQGFWAASQHILIQYELGAVIVSAFIGAFGSKEMNLKGFVGIVAKKPLKKVVDALEEMIKANA